VTVRDRDAVDTLTGVLLGAYVASGGPAAKRAAAWVTARATPPSLDAGDFAPDVDLRGKVGRVTTLLRCSDDDQAWITLRRSVDIDLGLRRSPVDDPTLRGLLVWWQATRSVPTVVSPEESGELAGAIAAIEGSLDGHPLEGVVAELRSALVDGVVREREVLLGVAAAGDEPGGNGDEPGGNGDEPGGDRRAPGGNRRSPGLSERPEPSPAAPRS
jgi:hypothetical protein